MRLKYCFWSVCDGVYAGLMEECVRSARAVGVFKEFHVLTDRQVEGAESYDAYKIKLDQGLFKLDYLKVGMSKLNFDYFVWLDADTVFLRNPTGLLDCLGKSPLHAPLEANLSTLAADHAWKGISTSILREALIGRGLGEPVYFSRSSFWVVHHDAIDQVYSLAYDFCLRPAKTGFKPDVSCGLGFAMQVLGGNPGRHLLERQPELWASDDDERLAGDGARDQLRKWREPFTEREFEMRPAIVHVPWRKEPSRNNLCT